MKNILLLGTGKSATVLIEYLQKLCKLKDWRLVIADHDQTLAQSKISDTSIARAVGFDANDIELRQVLINDADIVISLLPPALHLLIARDCIRFKKDLLTASYVDENLKALKPEIEKAGVLFLCEMGLDPGIDHMSAMELVHRIREESGIITSFKSHCGGLVAPQSDDNPWHYKISWNPRNVVLAGKSGAVYKNEGQNCEVDYASLFDPSRVIDFPEIGSLAWYPNRDSLSYIPLYDLGEASTFLRTTLRYPEFSFGWKHLVELKLTDEKKAYDTDGMSLLDFFKIHFESHGFSQWIETELMEKFKQTRQLLDKMMQLMEAEEIADPDQRDAMQEFMMVDESGQLEDISLDQVKSTAAATVAGQVHEANLAIKQLFYLGMDDDKTIINKGFCSAADVLQFALEQKLVLKADDKDMIVMMHEIGYRVLEKNFVVRSHLTVTGENNSRTAMAKTVGLPLGIAAKLILEEKIKVKGLHIPIIPQIYMPVLAELQTEGIIFRETITEE